MDSSEKAISGAVAIIMLPLTILSEGFALSKLWVWFIIPTFNLPALTLNTAVGITLIWGFLGLKSKDFKSNEDDTFVERLSRSFTMFLASWLVLLTGWIILAFK